MSAHGYRSEISGFASVLSFMELGSTVSMRGGAGKCGSRISIIGKTYLSGGGAFASDKQSQ